MTMVSKEVVNRVRGELQIRSSQKEGSSGTVLTLFYLRWCQPRAALRMSQAARSIEFLWSCFPDFTQNGK